MKTDRNRPSKDGSEFSAEYKRVVEHIVATTPLPRLFELYYWAQEPSLLRLLRRLVSLATEDRQAIEAFLKFITDNCVVTITRQSPDRLVLEAKHADELVSGLAHRLEDEELSSPHKKLN
jgi:hypothetical protein